jgi:ATP-dependent exoDNAse (exonuclease V) beta subunit
MSDKNFTIYKSSAGSGKTFTLVKEYLALALNDPSDPPQAYRHILAVTFTNKAAAEMKERIIKALKELAEDDYSTISQGTKTLLEILKNHEKLNASKPLDDATIRLRAKNILTAILHNYSDFAIGTIDAFVHKVVRTFAFDLKIPMSFEIEMDDEKLLTQAIDMLIAQIGKDERLTKALVDFTESKTDDEKSWHIENDLLAFAKNLLNEEGVVHIEKLRKLNLDDFFRIRETLFTEIKKFENTINALGNEGLLLIKNAGLSHDVFAGGDNGIGKYFTYLATSRYDNLVPSATIQKNVDNDKWFAGKASASDKSAIEGIKPKLLSTYEKARTFINQDLAEFKLFQLINKNIYSLAVLNEIEKLLEEYKSQNNVLHISEFNKMIARIVLNEPIPFIYERLGEKYNNYLIDEFQDTSVLQFQNLLPLIDNSLANGFFTMLVGDGKQAIYRWRGGEVEQFAMLPKVFSHNNNPLVLEREDALVRNHEPRVLNKNFRSKREIIEFNNAIFRTLSQSLGERYRGIYDDLEQQFSETNTGGFVQVEFIPKDDFREKNLERTLEIIQELQKDGFRLKDISILVRKNTDGSEIANFLTVNNIQVISSDSLLLSNSSEVNFIYSVLKFLASGTDAILQTEILEFMISRKYLKGTLLSQLLSGQRHLMLQAIRSVTPAFDVVRLSKMPLYELCEELLRIFNLNAVPDAYIQFFLDEVLNYTIKKNNNLEDFNIYWEERREKASLVVPQGMDAVSIMTVHRSKGLEFPVVILPFSNSKVSTGKNNLWIDLENEKLPELASALVPTNKALADTVYAEQYEDEKNKSRLDNFNVLYVALTRAEERMYILTGTPSKNASGLSSVSDMFAHFYQQNGQWSQANAVYTYGTAVRHKAKEHQETTGRYELKTFNSNQWREGIKMRAAAPGIWNTQMAEQKKDYGVMVHTALSRVRYAEDVPSSLESMVAEGLINIEEKNELMKSLQRIVAKPELAPHFKNGQQVKNEAEIILADARMFRPDRVVINGKNAVIIDYKTGKEKTEHQRQVMEYGDLLSSMGYTVTQRILVYLESDKLVTL